MKPEVVSKLSLESGTRKREESGSSAEYPRKGTAFELLYDFARRNGLIHNEENKKEGSNERGE